MTDGWYRTRAALHGRSLGIRAAVDGRALRSRAPLRRRALGSFARMLACMALFVVVRHAAVQAQAAPVDAGVAPLAPEAAATPAAVSGQARDQAPGAATHAAPAALSGAAQTPGAAAQATAPAGSGPVLEMPPEVSQPSVARASGPLVQLGAPSNEETLSRGLQDARLAAPRTVVGGYGQFSLNALKPGNADEFNANATVRRLVLFVAHPITDDIRVYTEFEWENALACSSCVGSAEVEQAFVNWRLAGDALALRVGLVLVPMGIINQWHEPPVFHGVERPMVDQVIIPSTWRELGAGVVGTLDWLRYELYLTTTLNPLKLGGNGRGLGNAVTLGAMAPAKAFALTGRAEVEPILGVIAGASFFLSDLGGNADYYNANKHERSLRLPLIGYALDARARRWGFEARAVWAQFLLPNSADLAAAYHDDGSPLFPTDNRDGAPPKRIQGGYVELAYDVLSLVHGSQQLLPFVRAEYYDTQASVPSSFRRDPSLDVFELTAGLTYRPITQLVFKADVQRRDRKRGYDEVQMNLGFGYMF
jgi:hypothetical protein